MSYPFHTLSENGYALTPVAPNSKRPILSGWADKEDHSYVELQEYQNQGYSVGILTKNTPCIDIDIRSRRLAVRMQQFCYDLIGKTVVRVGQKPKRLLIYRTVKPFKKMVSKTYWSGENQETKNQIEILGDGQQFVAYGTHPDTDEPYYYPLEELTHILLNELPILTVEHAQQVIDYFEENIPDGWVCKEDEKQAFRDYKPKVCNSLSNGQISPIEAYNEQHTIEDELRLRGDTKQGDKWLSHTSDSGNAGISIKDSMMYSHHSSDPLCDGNAHSSFDVMMHRLDLSFNEAVIYAAENSLAPDGRTVDEYNKLLPQISTTLIPTEAILDMSWVDDFTVSDEDMANISDPEWLFDNLIIKGHVIAIPAPSNGGKTTILMDIAGQLAKDINVFYVNADVPDVDAKYYHQQANKYGFKLLLPDMQVGKSMTDIVNILEQMNKVDRNYNDTLFIFDTLKKMTDVINKTQSKRLYETLRGLSAKGMTIILLCHTNKYTINDGELIFEGTGDLRSDVDELIYMIPKENPDGSITVSTRPDKTRGTFVPITFEIDPERNVSQTDYEDVSESLRCEAQKSKDEDTILAILDALEQGKNIQIDILNYCHNTASVGKKTIKRVLDYFSKGTCRLWDATKHPANNKITYIKSDRVY
ncbi:MAG: AAA family ATPase [gamma proteobacterium symbiont of Taylorina sp.]|nr:AAA family ATPase [gamma proteobacterium symbiont of Taylorina sp.]